MTPLENEPQTNTNPRARFISHACTHTSVKRERKFRRAYVLGGTMVYWGSTKEKGGAEKAALQRNGGISVSQRNHRVGISRN